MAWVTPKTNWAPADGVTNVELNNIGNNLQYLKDNTPQYMADNSLFVKKQNATGNEGGQIILERPTATQLGADVAVDILGDTFRIYTTIGGQIRQVDINLFTLPNGASKIPTYTAGPTDIQPGVTQLGANQWYVWYE